MHNPRVESSCNAARVGHNQINLLAKTRTQQQQQQQQLIYVAELGDICTLYTYRNMYIYRASVLLTGSQRLGLGFLVRQPKVLDSANNWYNLRDNFLLALPTSLIFMAVSGRVCGKFLPAAASNRTLGPGAWVHLHNECNSARTARTVQVNDFHTPKNWKKKQLKTKNQSQRLRA